MGQLHPIAFRPLSLEGKVIYMSNLVEINTVRNTCVIVSQEGQR